MSRTLPPLQTVSTGFVVAVVGFFSSFPIVLQGVKAVGATEAQAAGAVLAAALSMGITGIVLSLLTRLPSSVAWSTPGVALLAVSTTPVAGFESAVGAFLFAGALTLLSGLFRPLSRLAMAIPVPIAQAMLAGVLVWLCIEPFKALAEVPQTAVPIIAAWFVVGRFNRLFAVPAAVLAAFILTLIHNGFSLAMPAQLIQPASFVMPDFSLEAMIGIGLPLYIVTMATQNIPGLAVLRSFGYQPPAQRLLSGVGLASMISAPFGSPATCIAAITAVMCSNEDSHPDPAQRYWSAVVAGGFYCLFGLFAAVITTVAVLAPTQTLATLAGVALLGVFANSTAAALEPVKSRDAAVITFLVTASGITIIGLSAAVWGLLLGGLVYALTVKSDSA